MANELEKHLTSKLGNFTQAQKDRLKCAVHTAAQRILSDILEMKRLPEFDVQLDESAGKIVFVLTDRPDLLPFYRSVDDVEPVVKH